MSALLKSPDLASILFFLVLIDSFLELELLVPKVGEFLLELGAIPIELHQLFAVFRFLLGVAENCSQAGQVLPLLHNGEPTWPGICVIRRQMMTRPPRPILD